MKEMVQSSQNGCPGLGALSDLVDGVAEPGVQEHVARCRSCLKIVAAYQRLDVATKEAIQPGPGLAERIKARCRGECPEPLRFTLPWRRQLLSAAAVLTLFALLAGAMLHAWLQALSPGEAVAEIPAPAPRVTSPAPVDAAPSPAIGPQRAAIPLSRGRLEMAKAGTGPAAVNAPSYQSVPHMRVSPRVQHVWVVNDLAASREAFLGCLPEKTLVDPVLADATTASYQVLLSDAHLQNVVDRLAGVGFSLVSPMAPQPGRGHELVATGRAVRYEVSFVGTE